MKESLLTGNMALDLEISGAETPSLDRIVSPTDENVTTDNLVVDADNMEFREDQDIADNVQDMRDTSTREDFMTHLDQQLNKIEVELETFLRVSKLLLEGN
ncbi:hypothetical protein C2S52_011976 [Perilla frutescens var. hirtella]|nr:hypothetical protein C2S52_011976 [Perilla frutescens var. hirtella]KAH6785418.1 hypothetical protein C2S51_037873 [Perilla frutescens var. frutescens]